MTLQLPLRLALVAALAAAAGAVSAQETLDAVEPAQTDAVAVEMVEDAEVADADVDRRCLEATGSRVSADPQPATAKDNTERNGEDCTIGNGTVHTRKDIDQSGATTVKEALQRLDPRVF